MSTKYNSPRVRSLTYRVVDRTTGEVLAAQLPDMETAGVVALALGGHLTWAAPIVHVDLVSSR